MPKGFTDDEKELIRKRLVKAGYKQFSAYGLKKTNIEELAQAARISKGAFYLFYESKEALFMDVAELAEQQFRQELLATVDLPGPSPRARLYAILKKAFDLFNSIPILQFFTSSDYDLLFRRVPPEKLEEHMANDRLFFGELVARCHEAGISIRARPEEISSLLYPLVLAAMHEDDLGQSVPGNLDLLLELVSAYLLGEIELAQSTRPVPASRKGGRR